MLYQILKNKGGQSLVEVVIALGVLAIVFTGSLQVLYDSYFSITQEQVALKAHYLVVEGLEGMQSIRDEDWNVLVDGTWHFYFDTTDPLNQVLMLETGSELIENIYTRRIEVSSVRRNTDTGKITSDESYPFDANTKLIEVYVEWDYKGNTQSDFERMYVTNWSRY